MSNTFLIRRAMKEDLLSLAQLELRSSVHEKRISPITFNDDELAAVWHKRLISGQFDILVALQEKTLLGFVGVMAPHYGEGFVQALYVDPLYYRRGVGKALLQTAERIFILNHCPRVKLYVEPMNLGGMRFYQSLGYRNTNRLFRHLIIFVKEFSSC